MNSKIYSRAKKCFSRGIISRFLPIMLSIEAKGVRLDKCGVFFCMPGGLKKYPKWTLQSFTRIVKPKIGLAASVPS